MPITQNNPVTDPGELLQAARQLADRIAQETDRIDCERRLPPDLVGEMAERSLFRLLVPRSFGGAELSFPDFLQIVRTFARVDGSTAWCVNQNNVFATASVIMPEKIAGEIWGERRAVVANGPPTSSVNAVPVDGGYRLSGTWNFSTGSPHATWIAALAPVVDPDASQNAISDTVNNRILLIPKKDVNFLYRLLK